MSDEVCPFCRGDVRNRVCVLCGAEYVAAQHWNRRVEAPIRWRPMTEKLTFPAIVVCDGRRITIVTTAGHIPDDACYWIPYPERVEEPDPFDEWADDFVARAGHIDKAWLRKLWDAAQAAKETAK